MNKPTTALPTISRIKQRAKILKADKGISHTDALDEISVEYGFPNWKTLQIELKKIEQAKTLTPSPSIGFVDSDDVEMSDDDYELLDEEREADLSIELKKKITSNKKQLTSLGVEYSIFEPTLTGLKKSILDATRPVREHFEQEGFHVYEEQGQGTAHRVKKDAYILTDSEVLASRVSLYRPETKKGDPRMWFRNLHKYSKPGDQIAILIQEDSIYLINLSEVLIEESLQRKGSRINEYFESYCQQRNSVAEELLGKLRELAKAPMPALRKGDTAIGYTLETRLGIPANSSRKPDYKGIELKSGRGVKTRATIFAQVADWELSPCKKSAEILNKYGYDRDEDFKLYCTISTHRENTQGLSFIYDESKDELQEWYNKTELVAVWPGDLLRGRLKEKHAETFWVEASSEIVDGVEHFQLLKVTHTKAPVVTQLMPLIHSGVITMDHLIKRSGKTNRVSEKGPLFKMNKRDLDLLFPSPVTYSLI